jgi:uncharacterized protein UPF0175
MNVTVRIPDDLAARMTAAGADLERQALEGIALEAFRAGRLTHFELRQLLGFETRFELDGFLKERGVFEILTLAEVEEQVRTLERLGF